MWRIRMAVLAVWNFLFHSFGGNLLLAAVVLTALCVGVTTAAVRSSTERCMKRWKDHQALCVQYNKDLLDCKASFSTITGCIWLGE